MIARSRAIDHLRRRVPEPFDPETVATFVDRDSEDEADRLLERWRVAALISQLPKNEGRLLAMRFYDGLSQSQIAERTGLPLGTVKLRMRQAFTRLREAIDHEEGRR
jgi:RNA polymerase sigma-70 factor (ECF subfamily)